MELSKQLSMLLIHKVKTLGYFIKNYKYDLSKIDKEPGDISRSRYIVRIIEQVYFKKGESN